MTDTERSARADEVILEVRAELDVPGETGRQGRIFAIWLLCLALAVFVGSMVGAHIPVTLSGTSRASEELARSRVDKAKVAVSLGLILPALLTWGLSYHYRRGGGHARGITADVTGAGELRLWGRGYGTRLVLPGAQVSERLVDVYAGRLGAWRQRRLRVRGVRGAAQAGALEIEIATPAVVGDAAEGLRVEGGEGDCVELNRADYERLRAHVFELTRPVSEPTVAAREALRTPTSVEPVDAEPPPPSS